MCLKLSTSHQQGYQCPTSSEGYCGPASVCGRELFLANPSVALHLVHYLSCISRSHLDGAALSEQELHHCRQKQHKEDGFKCQLYTLIAQAFLALHRDKLP